MAVAWVQSVTGSFTGVSGTINITVKAGSAIVLSLSEFNTNNTATVSDGQGSYTLLSAPGYVNSAFNTLSVFYLLNASGSTHTITITPSSSTTCQFDASEYSGVLAIAPGAGNVQVNPGAGANAITSTAFLAANGSLVVGNCWDVTSTSLPTSSNGTIRVSSNNVAVSDLAGTGVSISCTYTDPNGGSNSYATLGFSLLPAGPPYSLSCDLYF